MSRTKLLTLQQIEEAKGLRHGRPEYWTKKRLARYYLVGETTIWWNILADYKRPPQPKVPWKLIRKICIPCEICDMCLTREIEDRIIPVNYRIGNKCICCYMESIGLRYFNLLEV